MLKSNSQSKKSNKILMVFESSNHNHLSIEFAVSLAASLKAAIEGVFIEDLDLLNVVDLPFIREIAAHTANVRETNQELMSRQLQNYSDKLRKLLESKAYIHQVSTRFTTIRSQRRSNIVQYLEDSKIIFFPVKHQTGDKYSRHVKGHYIAAIYDKSRTSEQCLEFALSVAIDKNLELLIISDDIQSELINSLNKQVKVTLLKVKPKNSLLVNSILKKQSIELLVLPASNDFILLRSGMKQHMNPFNFNVMIVR